MPEITWPVIARLVTLGLATAAVSYAVAAGMSRHGLRLGFVDQPNARSSHARSTPRGAGVGFALAVPAAVLGASWFAEGGREGLLILVGAATGLSLVSLADDRWGLPVTARLVAQIIVAAAVVWHVGHIEAVALVGDIAVGLGGLGALLTILWILAVTNLYNFMDGIDGLAASQALTAGSALAAVTLCLGLRDIALAMAMLVAGVSGFTVLNWPPARVFMGDVGSTFLGFMFGGSAAVVAGSRTEPLPLFAWIAVLSPFLFDGGVTLLRRAVRLEPLHKAHRSHLYQQLAYGTWGHRGTTLLYALLSASASVWTVLFYCWDTIAPAFYVAVTLVPLSLPVILLRRQKARPTDAAA